MSDHSQELNLMKKLDTEDADMLDEQEEAEKKRIAEEFTKKRIQYLKNNREVDLSIDDTQEYAKEALNQNLDQLIKESGEDIEFEFYCGSQ